MNQAADPILLVTDPGYKANPFGAYLGEILKTEGFVAHHRAELGQIDLPFLRRFALVVLAEAGPDARQREMLRQYVAGGGSVVAMRPHPSLADLFGLSYLGPRAEALLQYLAVDPGSEVGRGVDLGPLQYHGEADGYRLAGASAVAWLCDGSGAPSGHPAVAVNRHGEGQAVAFAFDLARSVALTRQGNPAWVCGPDRCEEGDGFPGLRPVDAFLRPSGERWVDSSRIPTPQADEQQRLLSNCLMALLEGVIPLPRLWYLPGGKKATLVMTGDGDDVGFDAFDQVMRAVEEYGGHFSAYLQFLEGDPTGEQVENWIARGHEVGLHLDFGPGRERPTLEGFQSAYGRASERFRSLYGRPPGPSIRHHWLTWYGWVETAEIAQAHGIRVDFNFYHGRQWGRPGGRWLNGYFTGSGLPQRFVREDGALLEVYQVLTLWADETQLYHQQLGTEGATLLVREMLDTAETRYPTVFVANFHPGGWKRRQTEPWARHMMQEAAERGMPIWSGEELYRFLAARDSTGIFDVAWDGRRLSFGFQCTGPGGPLTLTLPARFGALRLLGVDRDGHAANVGVEMVAGREYGMVETLAARHRFQAAYG